MSKSTLGRLGLLAVSLLGLMSLTAGSAVASGPPIVTVGAASNLSLNTATANGTVDKNGATSASATLEWGKTKLYGKSINLGSVTGTGAVPVSTILSALEPLTTYHYRITASNSFGKTVSEDQSFEMLLQWKVDGKPISELVEVPPLSSKNEDWTFTAEGTAGFSHTNVKFTCSARAEFDYLTGRLGESLHVPLQNCKGYENGNEVKECAPQLSEVNLNGLNQPTKNAFFVKEECAGSEKFGIPNFAVGPFSESVQQPLNFVGNWASGTVSLTYTISIPIAAVGGRYWGLKFGIS